ncbi:MAG: methionyl-tRNA formyltransferase [Tannerella sp.]|jgi:methionyl-tRNA formyltransferase|nr:methionyl-tRNA formyltransferase [Tannerella sp.]
MDKKALRIVYMGTPDFAVESLRALVEGGYEVVGVVTAPDKPVGRHGSVLQASPVKQYACRQGLRILQPERLKDATFLAALRALQADLQIVVAFRMLPEAVWNMPRFGTFNLHASLLPQYRGAAPIHWAIIRGEKETGVTTFFLTHEIDAGQIIRQRRIPVAKTDDAGVVHDKLMTLGATLVIETVDLLLAGNGRVDAIPQEGVLPSEIELRPAPKIFKETCRIDWHQPADTIYDFIRGLAPSPAAWTEWLTPDDAETLSIKIFQAEIRREAHTLPVGTVCSNGTTYLDVAVKDGFLQLLSVQLAGKKRLSVRDFLNGVKQPAVSVR